MIDMNRTFARVVASCLGVTPQDRLTRYRSMEAQALARYLFEDDPAAWGKLGEAGRLRTASHWLALRWAIKHGRVFR